MTRVLVMAMAAGLLFAMSESGLAAPKSRHPSSAQSKGTVKMDRGGTTRACDWRNPPPYDPRGTAAYPFGPGCNFPYPDRPYGNPDHW